MILFRTTPNRPMQETWARWFAWHPVLIETANNSWGWAWLEVVERKECIAHYGGYDWRYRELLP